MPHHDNDRTYADDAGIQHYDRGDDKRPDDSPGHVEHNDHHEPGEHLDHEHDHNDRGDHHTHLYVRTEYVFNLRTALSAYYEWATNDNNINDPHDITQHRTVADNLRAAAEALLQSIPSHDLLTMKGKF